MPDIQLPKTKMTIAEFAAAVKAAHPVYKDIPDNTLYQKMITAYPQYKDKVANPMSGDADAKTAQDKAIAKSGYGSRILAGAESTLPSIMAPPNDANLTDPNLTPEKLFAQNEANKDKRSYKQQLSDFTEPESLGQILGAGGQMLAGAGLGMLPVRKLASGGLNMTADVMEHPTTAGKMLAKPTRAIANYIKPKSTGFDPTGSLSAPENKLSSPSAGTANPSSTVDPVQSFKYPIKNKVAKNPPSIPSAPVDVPNMSPVDPRISNIAPEASITPSPLNTAFDPSKLVSPSNLRQSELLSKFGGRQTSNAPQDLSASGAVSGNTTAPALPIDQATSKVKPGLGITAAEPQNPAVSGVDPATHSITINGKTYPLDNNGNPIGLNAPSTFLQPKTPGAGFSIYPNFFKG